MVFAGTITINRIKFFLQKNKDKFLKCVTQITKIIFFYGRTKTKMWCVLAQITKLRLQTTATQNYLVKNNLQEAKFTHVTQFWWYMSSEFVAM